MRIIVKIFPLVQDETSYCQQSDIGDMYLKLFANADMNPIEPRLETALLVFNSIFI